MTVKEVIKTEIVKLPENLLEEVFESGFRVAIIPHTLKITTLSVKKVGDKVNIETDIIAKYVQRFLSVQRKSDVNEVFLKEHGFIKG